MTQSFTPNWLPTALRRPAVGYGVALLTQFVAVAYTSAILTALPHFAYLSLLSVLGIVLIALLFGPGPSLLATLLGALLLNFVTTPPYFRLSLNTTTAFVSFLLYVLVGVAIGVIAGQVERGRRVAERLAAQVAAQASQTFALQHERFAHEREVAHARVEALEASRRQMDVFLGLASHELRTPLTIATASVQIVRRQAHDAARLLEDLGADTAPIASRPDTPTMESAGQFAVVGQKLATIATLLDRSDVAMARLNRLVSDLLDASRIEAGRFEVDAQPCALGALLTEAVAEQRRAWPDRTMLVSLPAEAITVWGDPQRLKQVAAIFLSNALKFAPPDRPVRLRLERLAALSEAERAGGAGGVLRGPRGVGDTARIAVSDEGPGLAPEQQAQVWDRFARIPGIEQQQGSGVGVGLGLYIARAIVERHGGRVGMESVVGQGATFWYELPVVASGAASHTSAASAGRQSRDERGQVAFDMLA